MSDHDNDNDRACMELSIMYMETILLELDYSQGGSNGPVGQILTGTLFL